MYLLSLFSLGDVFIESGEVNGVREGECGRVRGEKARVGEDEGAARVSV